jgi:hypothetical protein
LLDDHERKPGVLYLSKNTSLAGKAGVVKRRSLDYEEPAENKYRTHLETGPLMDPFESLFAHDALTIALGVVLVLGVLAFAWFEVRRTSRLPSLGMVLVKNRLKHSK